MLTEDGAAFMTFREFDGLLEYSCTMPTGTAVGKIWKRGVPYMEPRERWLLGEYVKHSDPKLVGIKWREIFIVTPAGRAALESDDG